MFRESCLRILVVDNDVDTADSFATLLRLWGHDAEVCYHTPAAVEKARSYRPQVVLLDLGMPGMDGFQVATLLRGPPELANLVLIAITGYTSEAYRSHACEVGFDHYLLKPVDLDHLCELVGRVTRQLRRARQPCRHRICFHDGRASRPTCPVPANLKRC